MSKLMPLEQALQALVLPGMAVHLTTQSRAVTRALQRVFHGRAMDLTLIMGRVGGGHGADLVASGLVSRVIAGSYGAVSQHYTGPLPQIQKTHAAGQVSFQHWSFISLTQRLVAGAQGVPFVPTHSLRGTSMARDNAPEYSQLADPSGREDSIGVVTALHPDVSAVHVHACDEDGNAIMVPPLEDGAWGPRAARVGAIVTTEHVVSREFIRAHSHLVRLPSRYVRAVCHVPFGAHPGPFGSAILPELGGYGEDELFNQEYFAATRDAAKLEAWITRWILGQPSHQAYLEELGAPRLDGLKANAQARGTAAASAPVSIAAKLSDAPANTNEILMTLAMREVLRRIDEQGYDLLQLGVGLSEVPATAAWTRLQEQGRDINLIMGHGYYGFAPFPGYSEPDAGATLMISDGLDLYGVLLGGRIGSCLALLGTAQVDQYGNANSTMIGGKLLIGSGGSNDASSTADTIIVTGLSRRKLVRQVEYVTSPGTRLRAVVTEKGVFERDANSGRLVLTRYLAEPGKSREQVLASISEQCGWELEVAANLQGVDLPHADELALIRRLMPSRYQS